MLLPAAGSEEGEVSDAQATPGSAVAGEAVTGAAEASI
jgi:hypothetical protein